MCKKINIDPSSVSYMQIILNGFLDLNIKAALHLKSSFRRKHRRKFCYLGLGKYFLDMTLEHNHKSKNNKLVFVQMKTFAL